VGTNVAGRGTEIRPSQKAADAGGLQVIATERQHSSRIDRQLFGRAGRQGAPGSAVALVALDDALLMQDAPGPLRRLVATLVANDLPGGRRLGRRFVHLAQARAEAAADSSLSPHPLGDPVLPQSAPHHLPNPSSSLVAEAPFEPIVAAPADGSERPA